MTEPVDPQERYLERLRAVWNEDFGTRYRPGLADTFASSDASIEDLQRIGTMIKALDAQMATRLAQQSGAIDPATGEEVDLLNAVGAGHEAVKVANYHAEASADKDLPWWQDVSQWVGETFYGVDLTDPDLEDEAIRSAFTNAGTGPLMWGLEQISKAPGFLYRTARSATYGVLNGPNDDLGMPDRAEAEMEQRTQDKSAAGYNPDDIWDDIAFNWNQGESTFHDLTGVREKYGDESVDLALEVFRHGSDAEDSLYAARVAIENQFAAGEITVEEATAKIQRLEDEDFRDVYEAVDRLHTSPGRDLARAVLPDTWHDDWGFTAVSGTTDTLFTFFVDPTIIGSKVYKGAQIAKWGLESVNDSKIYHMLGEADEFGTAAPKKYLGNNSRRAGVENFLANRKAWDDALARGDEDEAAVIFAGAQQRHRDLFPLWAEVGGVRPAITQAERELAEKQGVRYMDANGVERPGIRTAPITTVREFADYAVNNFAFMRLTNGLASQASPLLPGRVGIAADRRAIRAEKRTREGIKAAYDEGLSVINFSAAKLNGIVPSPAAVKLEEAARLRGEEQFDLADAAEASARKMRYKADAVARRLSTFTPEGRVLRLNSAADSKTVEQFARIFLPKWEATRYASMWQAASPAGRRTLAKALLIQTLEASGLTVSAVGKELADKYINDLERLGKRRYGYGESDKITNTYRGELRAGLYESHIDEVIEIPSFTELRQAAAKAAVMGYDPNMSALGLNAASARQLAMGKGRRIPRLGTTALRYYLFSSPAADRFMKIIKLGWILTPANMTRNALDEGLLLNLTGNGGRLNRGREIMQQAMIRADLNPNLPRHRALQALIPKDLRPLVKTAAEAAHAISIGRLRTLRNPVSEQDIEFAKELTERTLADEVLEYMGGRFIDNPDDIGLGHAYAREAHKAGIPLERWKFQGYKLDEVNADTGGGFEALINSYGQRFMPGSPANAALAHIMWNEVAKNPEFLAKLDVKTIDAMQDALPIDNQSYFAALFAIDPNYLHAMGLTDEELDLFRAGVEIVPSSAPRFVKQIVDDPRYNRLQEQLEIYNIDEAGNKLLPDDVNALRLARGRMAPRYLEDIGLLMTGRNKQLSPELSAMAIRGELPDVNDLRALDPGALPPHAIKAQYGPVTEGAVNGMIDGVTVTLTKGYDFIVTRPIRALIRTPLYTDMYVTARHRTQAMADELVEKHGWERGVADDLAIKNAEKAALNEVIKFVDNPKVASQFATMNRNWWGFFRAQEDWLRRYGRAIKADPVIIQKAHLAIIGAEDAGILDRDADGNLILTYPGSGAVTEVFLHMGAFLGWTDPVMIPNVPDLTTRLTFTNPSLNNPFGYSSTPVVSLPWRFVSALAPGGELLKQVVDRRIHGELGAGREWWEQMLPGWAGKAGRILFEDDDNTGSLVGGATATAMTHLALNGTLEKYETDTPDDRTKAIRDIQQQARNVVGLRAFMALFAPGAPGMPQMGDDDSGVQPDPSYQQAGIQSLKAEFDNMVRRMGVGPAYTLWAELHPEASVFMYARRTESSPSAHTSATMTAASYIMDNKDFFTGKYKAVAPYFIPEAPGEFSDIAWRTMTELEVREYRDLDDMFIALVNANGTARWYKEKDANEAAQKEARLAGDSERVKELQEQWKATADELNFLYPTLDDYFLQGSTRGRARIDAVERLEELIADPEAPADVLAQLEGATDMVRVYREFEARMAGFGTARGNSVTAEKASLRVAYHEAMKQLISDHPSLEDAYNGIFRSLVEQE